MEARADSCVAVHPAMKIEKLLEVAETAGRDRSGRCFEVIDTALALADEKFRSNIVEIRMNVVFNLRDSGGDLDTFLHIKAALVALDGVEDQLSDDLAMVGSHLASIQEETELGDALSANLHLKALEQCSVLAAAFSHTTAEAISRISGADFTKTEISDCPSVQDFMSTMP